MRAGWLNVLAGLLAGLLFVGVSTAGAVLLHWLVRLGGGWIGELALAFVGVDVLCTFASFVVLFTHPNLMSGPGQTPSRRGVLLGLVVVPALLALLGLGLILALAGPERSPGLIRSAGGIGCIFLVLFTIRGGFSLIARYRRPHPPIHFPQTLALSDPNDPNQRATP